MRTFAFIFARGGSKGLPDKNIMELAGKPLIAYSISVAYSIPEIEKVFVSTDDDNIARIARTFNAEVIKRPVELAQDNSAEWLAWKHAINYVNLLYGKFDRFISLPATAPLRIKSDVVKCLDALEENVDVVITIQKSSRSPWFNMVKTEPDGSISLLLESNFVRRQDAPLTYDLTTVAYVAAPEFILQNNRIWDGQVRGVIIPEERAIDIDNQYDFKQAEILMLERMGLSAKK